MFMPNGVGNLQKGERYVFVHLIFNSEHSPVPPRYANMDYIMASAISHFHDLQAVGLMH